MSLVVLLALTLPTVVSARTWHVPEDAPTIQAGIDSASVGDDVLVAPGTYYEHDITMTAGIIVHSEQGPEVTVIDASSSGRVFYCSNLEQAVTIEGFGMRNGSVDGSGGYCQELWIAS